MLHITSDGWFFFETYCTLFYFLGIFGGFFKVSKPRPGAMQRLEFMRSCIHNSGSLDANSGKFKQFNYARLRKNFFFINLYWGAEEKKVAEMSVERSPLLLFRSVIAILLLTKMLRKCFSGIFL